MAPRRKSALAVAETPPARARAPHFWDASAVVPLLVPEGATDILNALYGRNPRILTWWGTRVEVRSALERRGREPVPFDSEFAESRLRVVRAVWNEILPSEAVRLNAEQLLREHPLRAADALQLSAAIDASGGDLATFPFVTLDRQLARAAQRVGFSLALGLPSDG